MSAGHDPGGPGVVVTGMGVFGPVGVDVASFTAALRQGRCGIVRTAGPGPDDKQYRAPLPDLVLADAVRACAGLAEPVRDRARQMAGRAPVAVQAATVAALQAWEQAGPLDPDRTGIVVGGNNLTGRYAEQMAARHGAAPQYLSPRFALHHLDTDHVGVLGEVLGIRGEGCTVGGASASGNLAIVNAGRLVASGAVDACLVVGAMADLSRLEVQGYRNVGAMTGFGDGPCPPAPFDEEHSGFVWGQACAALVLESRASARRRGATVLAGVAGYAACLSPNRLPDPSHDAEARAMSGALRNACLEPARLTYVNTHGTGSPAGDRAEVAALRAVLGGELRRVRVNATKSLTGHCLTSAGVVEAVATVVQMREGFLHPNAGLRRPIDAEIGFVGAGSEPADVAVALSNGFGFGGFNTSVAFVR